MGTRQTDVTIIGGGPAGLNAALRAAKLGGRAVLVEQNRVGGSCLNRGCVPTKALWRAAITISAVSRLKEMGILQGEQVSLSFPRAKASIGSLIDQIVEGTELRLEQSGVEVVKGAGRIVSPGIVEVTRPAGKEKIATKGIVVATGARPRKKPIEGAGDERILPSRDVLTMKELPRSIAIIGGTYIGAELACTFNEFGAQVHLIESSPSILPGEDEEVAGLLRESMEINGVNVYTGASIADVKPAGSEKKITIATDGRTREVSAEQIVDSTAEAPNTENLGLEDVGVALGDRGVTVDEGMRTNIPNIYAAGDIVGKLRLSHVAAMEGCVAGENAAGGSAVARYEAVPRCVYTIPEAAFVGLTEKQALERGHKIKTATLPLSTNAMARVRWEGEGAVKMIVDEERRAILGVHILGPRATDLIAESALAMVFEASPEILSQVVHAHPTLAEALKDIASSVHEG